MSTAEKVRLAEEATQHRTGVSFVARQAGVSIYQLSARKRRLLVRDHTAVQADGVVVGISRFRDLEERVCDPERLLGRKATEYKIGEGKTTVGIEP